MALPVPIILASVSTLAQMMNDKNAHQRELYKAQVEQRIASMQFELRRMEMEVEQQRIQAQKEIIQSLIEASQHAFDRKMDFFRDAFHRSHGLIEQHQSELLAEQRSLSERRFDDMPDGDRLRLNSRLSEINGTLIDLKKISAILTHEFNSRVSSLEMQHVSQQRRQLR